MGTGAHEKLALTHSEHAQQNNYHKAENMGGGGGGGGLEPLLKGVMRVQPSV